MKVELQEQIKRWKEQLQSSENGNQFMIVATFLKVFYISWDLALMSKHKGGHRDKACDTIILEQQLKVVSKVMLLDDVGWASYSLPNSYQFPPECQTKGV